MRLQDWPQYDDDRLTTMLQLQDYWDRLRRDRDRTYVLVFYENSHAPQPVFIENFLDDMKTFDGAICVVSHQPDIPLQSFSPHEPNLVVNMVQWIQTHQ